MISDTVKRMFDDLKSSMDQISPKSEDQKKYLLLFNAILFQFSQEVRNYFSSSETYTSATPYEMIKILFEKGNLPEEQARSAKGLLAFSQTIQKDGDNAETTPLYDQLPSYSVQLEHWMGIMRRFSFSKSFTSSAR